MLSIEAPILIVTRSSQSEQILQIWFILSLNSDLLKVSLCIDLYGVEMKALPNGKITLGHG